MGIGCVVPGIHNVNRSAVMMMLAACLAAGAALAEDEPAAPKPKQVILCPECGMIYNIRRIEKPIAPERDLMPNIASTPQGGTMTSDTRTVPLFSLGRGGPQRVQRDPTTRSVWEITVRYDSGQFGFLTVEAEPDLKVGDRVRMVENVLEPIPQTPH